MKLIRSSIIILLAACVIFSVVSIVAISKYYNVYDTLTSFKYNASKSISSLQSQLHELQSANEALPVFKSGNDETTTEPPEETTNEPGSSAKSTGILYIVRENNGFIGVFDKNDLLVKTTGIRLDSLSEGDRELISCGIILSSDDELSQLLADYAR